MNAFFRTAGEQFGLVDFVVAIEVRKDGKDVGGKRGPRGTHDKEDCEPELERSLQHPSTRITNVLHPRNPRATVE
jgi:hypothetical protein